MDQNSKLIDLRLKLASYGPIGPDVWDKIVKQIKEIELEVDESFSRELGSVAFIVSGLLKEYDVRSRKKPSIINFINSGNFITTTKQSQLKYLKAVTSTTLFTLDSNALYDLLYANKELQSVYYSIVANYEEGAWFRHELLEERAATKRIKIFIERHRIILSSLKKKDIANFTHIDYDYFIRIFGKLL